MSLTNTASAIGKNLIKIKKARINTHVNNCYIKEVIEIMKLKMTINTKISDIHRPFVIIMCNVDLLAIYIVKNHDIPIVN